MNSREEYDREVLTAEMIEALREELHGEVRRLVQQEVRGVAISEERLREWVAEIVREESSRRSPPYSGMTRSDSVHSVPDSAPAGVRGIVGLGSIRSFLIRRGRDIALLAALTAVIVVFIILFRPAPEPPVAPPAVAEADSASASSTPSPDTLP